MLTHRLRSAMLAPNSAVELNRSIRITRTDDGYRLLLRALGEPTGLLVAGWWVGGATDVAALVGDPGEVVSLLPASDFEWKVWRLSWENVAKVVEESGLEPTLLASPMLGWVLFCPSGSDDMFLYPELSATGN